MSQFTFHALKKGQRLLSPVGYIGTPVVVGYRRLQVISPFVRTDASGNQSVLAITCAEFPSLDFNVTWWDLEKLLPGDSPIIDMPEYGRWLPDSFFEDM